MNVSFFLIKLSVSYLTVYVDLNKIWYIHDAVEKQTFLKIYIL